MSDSPDSLRFTEDHEWLRPEGGGAVVLGITEHAQDALGDLVYVQLPDVGRHFAAGEEMAVIESVKAASDIKAPLAGTVTAVNSSIVDDPAKVNSEPMDGGWFIKFQLDDPAALDGLLTAEGYNRILGK